MPRVLATATVEDSAKWEESFRTHKKLFKKYSATAIHYTSTPDNQIAIYWRVKNLDKFFAGTEMPETVEAMAFDGVRRDTVKFFVLDKKFNL
ncbi:MAG TPA: hypothetical protein VGC50_02605 [Gammaproteobacteria bacterium]|jgi:hypothetical protein